MANARRCSIHGDWPNTSDFAECPECEETTSFLSNGNPPDLAEALSRKAHAEFERYYAKRDAERDEMFKTLEASLDAETVDGPVVQTGLPKPKGPLHG